MRYLEWNNIIGDHFFNPGNAGSEVHLYLPKQDIINLAKARFNEKNDQNVWDDFIGKIKTGLPAPIGYPTIIDKAKHTFIEWNRRRPSSIDGIEVKYPTYVAYLVFFVLPLIEIKGDYYPTNYYDRLADFLRDNNIIQNLKGRLKEIDALWLDLSKWANDEKNGELGFFRIRNFVNENWIYVGKPFSQCIFSPKSLQKLPELFLQAGMIPNSIYPQEVFKNYLLRYGSTILLLPNNVIEIIKKSDSNELGQSIIETVRKEYSKWTGEAHSIVETGTITVTRRNDISARIYLQFQLFTNVGRIEFSFRMKSANEFPEDLNFGGVDVREEKGGYSRTINLPFKSAFSLKDDFNKWVAKFQDKDVRLFISGGILQFSTDYWIETDSLSKTNWMYLLCKNSKREQIFTWLKSQCSKFEDETDYSQMPSGYSLFKFLNPKEGLNDIPELILVGEKNIQLVAALNVDFRTFTDDFLPEVEIVNSDGTEKVYLQYKNSTDRYFLTKKLSLGNRWLLPEDISLYTDFNIKVEGQTFKENGTTYRIVSSSNCHKLLDESKLPKRNSFGRVVTFDITQYSVGSNTVGASLLRQFAYTHLFKGRQEDTTSAISQPVYTHSEGNILLAFLTLKCTATAQDFYVAFEFLHSKYFGNKNQSSTFSYTAIKKAALNFFDYLGYLDYEYETKSIVVNPPQLIFIPTNKGRKLLLIGGRDLNLVNAIIAAAPKHNLQVEITRQFKSNEDLLLPDVITIKSFGSSKEGYGEKNLLAFANELEIKFNSNDLVQVGLQHFCSSIDEYEKDMLANKEAVQTYEDWARYVFNEKTLQLDKSMSDDFDKDFSLLEYRLRPWEFYHRIWISQKCYDTDKNWGKYLALKHYKMNVILYDSKKERVAIPVELPLPRLLAESIMLLSGFAPVYQSVGGKPFRIYENIPSVFIQNFFSKLGQKTINYNL